MAKMKQPITKLWQKGFSIRVLCAGMTLYAGGVCWENGRTILARIVPSGQGHCVLVHDQILPVL